MSAILTKLLDIDANEYIGKREIVDNIKRCMEAGGYTTVEVDDQRPWGAFIKFDDDDAGSFVTDFFPGLSLHEAKLGDDDAEISPKILIVSPNQRLSWQLHTRRAERWAFLTDGFCNRSVTDDEG